MKNGSVTNKLKSFHNITTNSTEFHSDPEEERHHSLNNQLNVPSLIWQLLGLTGCSVCLLWCCITCWKHTETTAWDPREQQESELLGRRSEAFSETRSALSELCSTNTTGFSSVSIRDGFNNSCPGLFRQRDEWTLDFTQQRFSGCFSVDDLMT